MKAHYKTANGRMTFEVEGEDPKTLFKKLAGVQELFDAEKTCGVCGSGDIRLQHRTVDEYDFYELRCAGSDQKGYACGARFQFGQAKKGGGLFPKRKDEDGKWLPNRGWERYQAPASKGEGNA